MAMGRNRMRKTVRDPELFASTLARRLEDGDPATVAALIWHVLTGSRLSTMREELVRCAASVVPPARAGFIFTAQKCDPVLLLDARQAAGPDSGLWRYIGEVLIVMAGSLPSRQAASFLRRLEETDDELAAKARARWGPIRSQRREDRLPLVLTRHWAFVEGGCSTEKLERWEWDSATARAGRDLRVCREAWWSNSRFRVK